MTRTPAPKSTSWFSKAAASPGRNPVAASRPIKVPRLSPLIPRGDFRAAAAAAINPAICWSLYWLKGSRSDFIAHLPAQARGGLLPGAHSCRSWRKPRCCSGSDDEALRRSPEGWPRVATCCWPECGETDERRFASAAQLLTWPSPGGRYGRCWPDRSEAGAGQSCAGSTGAPLEWPRSDREGYPPWRGESAETTVSWWPAAGHTRWSGPAHVQRERRGVEKHPTAKPTGCRVPGPNSGVSPQPPAKCIGGITRGLGIGHEGREVSFDDIPRGRIIGINILGFHEVIFLCPATSAGELRSVQLCRVGNRGILEFSRKLGGFKTPRGITPEAA